MRRALRIQELGLVLVILLLGGLLTVFGGRVPVYNPDAPPDAPTVTASKFLRAENLVQVAKNTSFFAIMAVGMAIVIMSGGIDLSVGAIYALAAMAGAMVFHRYGPLGPNANSPPWVGVMLGIGACLAVGTLCGILNGLLVVGLRVHPFIITLGTMEAFRGIAFVAPGWFAADGEVAIGQTIGDFPPQFTDQLIRREFSWLGQGLYPVPMLLMLLVAFAGWFVLRRTVFGRHVIAIGSNESAARLCGIPIPASKVAVYAISGLCAGLASAIFLGYYGAASSDAGMGYELMVIASAVVGGASLAGGRGSAIGALLGALILQLISNAIIVLSWPQEYSRVITGAVIIVAVVLDRLNTVLATRRSQKT